MVGSEVMAMKADMEKDTVKFGTDFTRVRKKIYTSFACRLICFSISDVKWALCKGVNFTMG